MEKNIQLRSRVLDEILEYCLKMMHVPGKSNVVADYLSRPPDPITAICSSLTSTPSSVRFKIEVLAVTQDVSADLLEGDYREVCSKEVIIDRALWYD